MKAEKREDGITLIYESEFEREVLKWLQKDIIGKIHFEDDWESKGKLYIDFDHDWGR